MRKIWRRGWGKKINRAKIRIRKDGREGQGKRRKVVENECIQNHAAQRKEENKTGMWWRRKQVENNKRKTWEAGKEQKRGYRKIKPGRHEDSDPNWNVKKASYEEVERGK